MIASPYQQQFRKESTMSDFETPAVEWRDINGAVPDENGKKLPPGLIPYSTSEGDMRRRSYRHSKYPGAFTQGIANDDGTPIAEGTEALLGDVKALLSEMIVELRQFNKNFQTLLEME